MLKILKDEFIKEQMIGNIVFSFKMPEKRNTGHYPTKIN
jgi:hypothetical protein